MSDGSRFEALVNRLPVDTDRLVSEGLNYFISNQDPENVEFVAADNGYAIRVYTDRENVDSAKEFWESEVHPKLNGEME